MPSYREHLQPRLDADGRLNDFIRLRDGRLLFADDLDLQALAHHHGTPLEISFCPLITQRIHQLQHHFATARTRTNYQGTFIYAYATKANFAEEVVRTAMNAGAHYETSSPFDVRIAHRLWQRGILPSDRLILCNGSKEQPYIDAIIQLRCAGFTNIIPILDDLDEFSALADCPEPLLLGVRERKDPTDLAEGATYGSDRFGMLPEEIAILAARVASSAHRIILYHTMVGSQLDDQPFFIREIRESFDGFARLHTQAPTLAYLDFGGGIPTNAYHLGARFNYADFAEHLQRTIGAEADAHGLPHPHLIGELGRYTVADHGLHIFHVGRIKPGHPGQPPWYLLNGSLMITLPDTVIVKGQQFITLPLNYLDAPAGNIILGGRRTCDSDDFYPRPDDPPLILPLLTNTTPSEPLLIACFGTGAYQAMMSGEGGAHHCLAPEPPKLIIEDHQGIRTNRLVHEQSWEDVLSELGYTIETAHHLDKHPMRDSTG